MKQGKPWKRAVPEGKVPTLSYQPQDTLQSPQKERLRASSPLSLCNPWRPGPLPRDGVIGLGCSPGNNVLNLKLGVRTISLKSPSAGGEEREAATVSFMSTSLL